MEKYELVYFTFYKEYLLQSFSITYDSYEYALNAKKHLEKQLIFSDQYTDGVFGPFKIEV